MFILVNNRNEVEKIKIKKKLKLDSNFTKMNSYSGGGSGGIDNESYSLWDNLFQDEFDEEDNHERVNFQCFPLSFFERI